MIVKMKQVTILVADRHREAALIKLRQLGVLHVRHVQAPASEDIKLLEMQLENVETALTIIGESNDQRQVEHENRIELEIKQVIEKNQLKETLSRELAEYKKLHRWFETWSAVSYHSLKRLNEAGIFIRFYIAEKKALKNVPADKIIVFVSEVLNQVQLVLISESPDDKLDFHEDVMPAIELSELEEKISQLEIKIMDLEKAIASISHKRHAIYQYRLALLSQLKLNKVKCGMGSDGEIAFLQGFCPIETVPKIRQLAEEHGFGYLIDEPDDPTQVPTLIRNPKWIGMIKPIFDFMGTLPGYHEMDVSFVFLVFFSIFYAIIVGDAGYGLVLLLATFLFSHKSRGVSKEFCNLMYLLSFATIIWGAVTGTWFGSQQIAHLPFLKLFIIKKIYSYNPNSSDIIMQLTFFIGVVHLSIGHLMAAFRKINTMSAIAEIGWVLVLWAVFFVANNIVLGKVLSEAAMPLLIIGAVLILLFANFQKNVLKGMLSTLANLPLGIISSFSDIVSYIRLFAVGLATVIVASSFNTIAMGSGISSIVSGIFAAIVLLIGHSINLALSGMSVLVHGVRLNMLEFSGHIGIQWNGKPYEPFKE